MAQEIEVYKHCPGCEGNGVYRGHGDNPVAATCIQCGGDGKQTVGHILFDPGLNDIMDKVDDIKEKVDEIKEVVDAL